MTTQTVSLSNNLQIVLAGARMRILTISRYPGQLVMDIIMPIVMAAM